MTIMALRGATSVDVDDPRKIGDATQELLRVLMERNGLRPGDVISAFFTCTPDLVSAYPATAARAMGWNDVPMLCAADQAVPGMLPHCIRVLLHVHAGAQPARHAYLRDAVALRGDLEAAAG